MTHELSLQLCSKSDSFGLLHGTFKDFEDVIHRVMVLPPADNWQGDIKLRDYKPDKRYWLIYFGSDMSGKAESKSQIEESIFNMLS